MHLIVTDEPGAFEPEGGAYGASAWGHGMATAMVTTVMTTVTKAAMNTPAPCRTGPWQALEHRRARRASTHGCMAPVVAMTTEHK
jgi:hypothetical protein